MTPFLLWLFSILFMLAAFFFYPMHRIIIALLFFPYLGIFIWGVFDLRLQFFLNVFLKNRSIKDALCLTFDDGPDNNLTPDVLDILKKHGMRATFFVIGEKAKNYPQTLLRAYTEGHCIACHDLTHALSSNFRFAGKMLSEIGQAQSIIESVIGKKPLLYRPPVGLSNPHLAIALAKLDMLCIGWSRSTKDAGNRRLGQIRKIKDLASAGQVLCLHDCLPVKEYKQEYLDALEKLCISMKEKNIAGIGVDEMFGVDAYNQEN